MLGQSCQAKSGGLAQIRVLSCLRSRAAGRFRLVEEVLTSGHFNPTSALLTADIRDQSPRHPRVCSYNGGSGYCALFVSAVLLEGHENDILFLCIVFCRTSLLCFGFPRARSKQGSGRLSCLCWH